MKKARMYIIVKISLKWESSKFKILAISWEGKEPLKVSPSHYYFFPDSSELKWTQNVKKGINNLKVTYSVFIVFKLSIN